MTSEQLQAIRERVNKATPGPWKVERRDEIVEQDGTFVALAIYRDDRNEPNDAEFIAHAREDVPALLDYADSLKKDTENIASAFSKVNRENLHLKDQIERLRGALEEIVEISKEDMFGYTTEGEIARKALSAE